MYNADATNIEMPVLVTGAAGFIGFHLCKRLLSEGIVVIGYDNINDYYDQELKRSRLSNLKSLSESLNTEFHFIQADLIEKNALEDAFLRYAPTHVVNLAAQAGVRYSLENPDAYINSNIVGFTNILECCRKHQVEHLVYASSSSVYGGNTHLPFSEKEPVDHPVSLYAATKKSNELMAHCYSHLFQIPTTGLRFFTVYGPWGRPDMALFLFTKAILQGKPIDVFNNGRMTRDFTYIDDIIESIYRLTFKPALPDPAFDKSKPSCSSSWAPYRIFNIGNSSPTRLLDYIGEIEVNLKMKSRLNLMPIQPGDVPNTASDTSLLEEWIGFKPKTNIKDGVRSFIDWYKSYYAI